METLEDKTEKKACKERKGNEERSKGGKEAKDRRGKRESVGKGKKRGRVRKGED